MGVKWRRASACNPTWSSVDRVLASQIFLAGHHNAWLLQSLGKAKNIKNVLLIINSDKLISHRSTILILYYKENLN